MAFKASEEEDLRSKKPELVKQEFYALLLTHAAIRKLMTEAADRTQQSAVDLSFIHAVQVLQRRMPSVGAIYLAKLIANFR